MSRAFAWPYSGTLPLAALLGLTAPAPPVMAQGLAVYVRTPTGLAETLFDSDPAGAARQVADQCLAGGLELVERDDMAVTCRLPEDRDAGARLDLGRAAKSARPIFYRFQLEERGDATRVLASGWEEVGGFWGGTEQRELADPAFHNALIDLMVEAGGRLPPGTRFPNHAMIGADFIARERPEQALEVMAVEADSPAMRAGLQVGDLVTRIANRRTRTLEDLNRSLVDAAGAARFEIRFLRDGREGVALLRSEFRPAVTAPVLAEVEEPAAKIVAAEEPAAKVPATASLASFAGAMHAGSIAGVPAMVQPVATAAIPQPHMSPVAAPPAYPSAPLVPLTYAMPQPYGGVPYAMGGAALPPATVPAAPPPAPAPPRAPEAASFSVADELTKFATLLEKGVITQAEFDAQKARLLAQ